jgi:hypothetical protein
MNNESGHWVNFVLDMAVWVSFPGYFVGDITHRFHFYAHQQHELNKK